MDTGVIIVNPQVEPVWSPQEFVGGPRAAEVAVNYLPHLANSGVEIGAEWAPKVQTSSGAPDCPSCGRVLDDDHWSLIEQWWEQGEEPVPTCRGCGGSAPLGDWPGEDTAYVGELWVTFYNWSLTDAFVSELGGRLGPRWRRLHLEM